MPRTYNCKKCNTTHQPPTGKQCTRDRETVGSEQSATQNEVLNTLLELKAQMDGMQMDMRTQMEGMEQRMQSVENGGLSVAEEVEEEEESEEDSEEIEEQEEQQIAVRATPENLRKNTRLMARAADRLARLRLDEEMAESDVHAAKTRKQGKKSGSIMLASDVIEESIDWPHLHVKRAVGSRRKCVPYTDLRVEEFVFGFIAMIRSPKASATMDKEQMITLLQCLMQDAMDYNWANARGFYEELGLEVEKGGIDWGDTERIWNMRMLLSRAVFPDRKDSAENNKQQNKGAAGLRCCALYQKRNCEHFRDHHPFTHACAFCARTVNMLCRHPEEDCVRKQTGEAKNSKGRE